MDLELDGFGGGFSLGLGLLVGLVLLALALLLNHDASLSLGVVALLVADHPRVDHLRAVSHHLFDQSLLHQLNESPPDEGASHLKPLRHDGGCDELVSGDLLVQLVIGALVEQHQVVQLVPGLSLGPLLLLSLAASSLLLLGGLGGGLGILLGILLSSHDGTKLDLLRSAIKLESL